MPILRMIEKSLTTDIPPMMYILMFVSVFIGFSFMTGIDMASGSSILYGTGVLINKVLWGGILFFTASIAEIGFITKTTWMIKLGGIAGFMVWLFACIALFMAAHWYVLVTVGILHLLFHGYVYLSTALGLLFESQP